MKVLNLLSQDGKYSIGKNQSLFRFQRLLILPQRNTILTTNANMNTATHKVILNLRRADEKYLRMCKRRVKLWFLNTIKVLQLAIYSMSFSHQMNYFLLGMVLRTTQQRNKYDNSTRKQSTLVLVHIIGVCIFERLALINKMFIVIKYRNIAYKYLQ